MIKIKKQKSKKKTNVQARAKLQAKSPVKRSRSKTDKSLLEERHKTDSVIKIKREKAENEADEDTRKNRKLADTDLKKTREKIDRSKIGRQYDESDKKLFKERERSDKAQAKARDEEDKVRDKERFKKRLIAESLLESERKATDSNLLEERQRSDTDHTQTKEELITRDEFIAVVSHDLKNPLSAIHIGAHLLRAVLTKGAPKESLYKYLEMIEQSASSMDRLISDLLDVERMSHSKFLITTKKNNISDLLQECSDLFAPIVLNKSSSMTIETTNEEMFAEIDHDKILQVLSNLIGNALKFSPKGSVITLAAKNLGQEVEISVTDDGPGISEDKKTKIFERFSQLKSEDRRGLGLGLYITKWIVEAHKGKIRVNSHVGKGSSFIFTLPRSKQL
jgi:signal transduction histidine kinase